MLKSSFLWRLYAAFVSVIILCALIIYTLLNDYLQENNNTILEQDLMARGQLLRQLSLPFLQSNNAQGYQELSRALKELDQELDTRFTVIDANGVVLAESRKSESSMDNHASRPEVLAAIRTGQGQAERYSDSINQNMKYLALSLEQDGKLMAIARVALAQKAIDQQQAQLTRAVLSGCLFASSIALLLGFIFSRRISRDIAELTRSAEALAQGDYQQRVYLNRYDEIGKLAQAFNFMAASAHDRMKRITEDRNKLSAILSGLSEGVIAVDSQQHIIHINQAAAQSLGISASASLGTLAWGTIRNAEIHEILQRVLTEGGIHEGQIRIPGKKGDTIINLYGAALEREGDGFGAILVLQDISDLERLEKVRRDFVTNASHELKTPLTAIRGVIETILSDPDMDRKTLWHFLERMQHQTERLVSIVSDLMALSRLESGKQSEFEPVSVKAVVKQSIKSFRSIAEEKHITLHQNLDAITDDAARIMGDAHTLGQLFDNLIDNAIKYTPTQGNVSISISSPDPQHLQLSIADSGVGIAKAEQSRVFERFYRVDKGRSRELGGTGLGLAISKHIVEQHHGRISLDSEPGKGSCFTVVFPALH